MWLEIRKTNQNKTIREPPGQEGLDRVDDVQSAGSTLDGIPLRTKAHGSNKEGLIGGPNRGVNRGKQYLVS